MRLIPLRSTCLLVALVLAGCGGQTQAPPAPPPPEVGVLDVQPRTEVIERELVGRLAAFRSADVRARVAGVLLERVYAEGSDVKEGDVLFRIDPAPLRAALAQAEASLAQAQANYTNARIAAERGRELAPKNYISRADLDGLEAAERSTAAAVKQAEAVVAAARINLEYATVRAPISGRAGKQQVTEGALVGQGAATLLTTIEQIDTLYVNFSMGQAELAALRQAQAEGQLELAGVGEARVRVVLPGGVEHPHEGTVDFSDVTVDPATGAVSLRARVPNPDLTLLPGAFVTLKVRLGERHGVFVLPQSALLRDPSGAYVWLLLPDGTVTRRDVTVDSSRDGNVLITAGLEAGDRVITSGLQKVREGAMAVPSVPAGTTAQAGGGGDAGAGPDD
jgi:membrane fusion protein (multidrug efflux system)